MIAESMSSGAPSSISTSGLADRRGGERQRRGRRRRRRVSKASRNSRAQQRPVALGLQVVRGEVQLADLEQQPDVVAVVLRALPQPPLVVGARLARLDGQLRGDVAVDVRRPRPRRTRGAQRRRTSPAPRHRVVHRLLQVREEVVRDDADRAGRRRRGTGRRCSPAAATCALPGSREVVPGDGAEHQRAVLHRAGHRPDGVHAPGERHDARVAHPADRSGRSPTMPLTADGSRIEPPVSVPSAPKHGAGRDRGAGAAAGAGREAVGVPRVAHRAVVRVGRGAAPGELVHVGLAEQDRAGALAAGRATVASASGRQSARTLLPAVVTQPARPMLSFSASGMPCSGPSR